MAQVSSGSFTTSSSYGRSLTFNWSVDSTSISGNYKKIYWSLVGSGSATGYVKAGNFKVVIDGETVYEKDKDYRIELWQGTVVASGYKTLYHNNTGNKSFSASVEAGIYAYARNCSGSGSWELPTIPRYGTSNQSLNSKTETTIKMNWSSDNTVDYLWYSKDNGSSWTGVNVTDGTSGNYTISGLSANTTYNIKTRIRRKDSQLTTDSSALSVTTYNYPYCNKSPNFVIGNALKLEFYNPLGRKIKVTGYSETGGEIFTGETTGTSLKGFNDSNSVAKQYASLPNMTSKKYKVVVVYGSAYMTRDAGNTYSVNTNLCIPTFNNFTYKDTNTKVTAVTGNDQILVKGLSTLQLTISSANKMVTKNSATGNKYIATIDTLNKSVNYSTSDINLTVGTVVNAGTKRLNVTAYDSRNISKNVYKDITVYDYGRPNINIDVSRLNNFEAETTFKVSGTYSRLTIGGTDKNTIKYVEYRYRETNGTWSTWTPLSTTVTSGKFTCSNVILSLDNTKSFEFEVQVFDNLNSYQASSTLDIGEAIFFISSNKKSCYVNGEELMYTKGLANLNANSNKNVGVYMVTESSNATNYPATKGNGILLVFVPVKDQIVYQIFSQYDGTTWVRMMWFGNWGSWKQISN